MWAVAIGVLAVALATVLFRLVNAPARCSWCFDWCVGLVAGLVALVVDVSPGTGAAESGGRAAGRRGPLR